MMLIKLKRTFVLLCTSLTGLVLMAACLLAFGSARAEIERHYAEAFESQSQSLSVFLAGTQRLHYNQFYQIERDAGTYVYFYDSGAPIYNAESHAESRDAVYAALVGALEKTHPGLTPNGINLDAPVNTTFSFEYCGEAYLGKVVSTPTGNRQWYSYALARPIAGQLSEIRGLAVQYTGIYAAGLALLFLIAWALARRAVKPVESAQQRQKEFIAAASHELKTPLAVIVSSVDVLENTKDDLQTCCHTIRSEAKRMSRLVGDMLLLAGAQTGKWSIKKAPANLEDVLAGAYERYLSLAAQNELSLRLCLGKTSLPVICADEERLHQVLCILLSNAISYTPPGGEVVLGGETEKKSVVLRVQDNGPGIADKDKEHIFDSFYRSENRHSEKAHFGLGLAVAKELVALHGGTITAEDTPGGGATFVVKVPITS